MKKTILMLDHEPLMIDRRIVLEAQTLVKEGYRVILATRSDGTKPNDDIERGMEIKRFPRMPQSNNIMLIRAKIHGWLSNPGNEEKEKKIRSSLRNWPRKFQSLAYAIAEPMVFAAIIRTRLPILKKIFRSSLEPLVCLFLLRPHYLFAYARLWFHQLYKKFKIHFQLRFAGVKVHQKLDDFQLEIYSYACTTLRPDFVHVHDLPNLYLGSLIRKTLEIPLIYDAHELYPLQKFSDKKYGQYLAELERKLIKSADAVIAVNQQCSDILEKEYPGISNITILSNATEAPDNFVPAKRKKLWHERFELDCQVKVMVFQGGINPVRNVDPLVKALPYLDKNIHIGFVTYRKDAPYYQLLASELGVLDRVHFIFEIPWDEVIDWLSAADLGVMPYQAVSLNARISSPNKMFEFMVAGLPILASSDLENVREVIDKYNVGMHFPLSDDSSYISALQEFFSLDLSGPEKYRPNVLEHRHLFMWSNEEPKLLNLYSGLCSGEET